MTLVNPKIHDYFSIFQERAHLHKNIKEQQNTKAIIKKYIKNNQDNIPELKAPKLSKPTNEKNREIERENGILSKKLIEIISKRRSRTPDISKTNISFKKDCSSQKNNEIQSENCRLFYLLNTMKPLINTKDLKKEWKITKKYKRNIRSFNKFNQPKHELTFLNYNCNKNIDNYLKESYLPDKSNILNNTSPNYICKKHSEFDMERIIRQIDANKIKEKKSISCEICKKKQQEKTKKTSATPAKLLLDYSMII